MCARTFSRSVKVCGRQNRYTSDENFYERLFSERKKQILTDSANFLRPFMDRFDICAIVDF
jgi:hypothetical protein